MKANYVIVRRPNGFRVSWICVRRRRIRGKRVWNVEEGSYLATDRSREDAWLILSLLFDCWSVLEEARLNEETWRALCAILSLTPAAPVVCCEPTPLLRTDRGTDVRAWLCDPDALAGLLAQLRPHATRWTEQNGTDLERYGQSRSPEGEIGDVYLYYNHGHVRTKGDRLTAILWEDVMPWLRGLPWEEVFRVVEKWERLHEDNESVARALLGRVEGSAIEGWLDFFLEFVEAEERDNVFQLWMTHRAFELSFSGPWRELVEYVWEGRRGNRVDSLIFVWRSQYEHVSPARVRGALFLVRCHHSFTLPVVGGKGGDCSGLLLRLEARVAPSKLPRGYLERLYRLIGTCPGAEGFLAEVVSRKGSLASTTALVLLTLDGDEGWERDGLWWHLGQYLATFEALIASMHGDHHARVVECLRDQWCDAPKPRPPIEEVLAFCSRLGNRAYQGEEWNDLLGAFRKVDPEIGLAQLRTLPEGSWKRLGEVADSWSRTERVSRGLQDFGREQLPFVILGLRYRVRLACQLLESLGQAPKRIARRALSGLETHPLYGIELEPSNVADHLCLLESTLPGGAASGLKRLKQMVCGERVLRVESLTKLLEKVQGFALEEVLHWVQQELQGIWEAERRSIGEGLQDHTFRLARDVEDNRRSLRRALCVYRQRGETELHAHVQNKKWLRDHRSLVERGWLRPPAIEVETPDGPVRLWIESRFEEVLKMGTLVDSCLGLGGAFCGSAVANALDINKQVVMACDRQGRFKGRQLVAVSEEGTLVCFEVYAPQKVAMDLKKAFATYDKEFSRQLGVPCQDDKDYVVPNLVCRDWYDDGNWELKEMPDGLPFRILLSEQERPVPVFDAVCGF